MPATLITGTSKGIGLVMAVELAKAGHDVYGTMRNPDSATDLQAAAQAAGVSVHVVPLNVTDDASVTAATGPIDILVSNTGIAGQGGPPSSSPSTPTQRSWRPTFTAPCAA